MKRLSLQAIVLTSMIAPIVAQQIACDPEPPPPRSPAARGDTYCRDLTTSAKTDADDDVGVAAVAGALGLTSLALGATVLSNQSGGSNVQTYQGSLLTLGAVPLTVIAYYFLQRADAAYALSQQANDSRAQPKDGDRMQVCAKAWGAWEASHLQSDEIIRAALNEKYSLAAGSLDGGIGLPNTGSGGGGGPGSGSDGGAAGGSGNSGTGGTGSDSGTPPATDAGTTSGGSGSASAPASATAPATAAPAVKKAKPKG